MILDVVFSEDEVVMESDFGETMYLKGDKGEPFRYEDFTPEQLEALKGADGEDGFSPVIFVENFTDGHNVRLIDKMHPGGQMFTVFNGTHGAKGDDGFSPIVDVEEIEGGHRVTITDAAGDHVFDVMDGSGGGSPADGVYVTDGQGRSWYVPTGEGEDAPVILDENGDAWHLLPGTGGEDDIAVTDGDGNDWHFARAEEGGGSLPSGGTDGQYLVKDSTAEGGAKWADLPSYSGVWSVTPLVNTQTTLETAQTYLDRDIVVEAIPYAEVSNISGGTTATIGG